MTLSRFSTPVFCFAAIMLSCPVLAGPADLLRQAIEETEGVAPLPADNVEALIQQADLLADQKKFTEAIALYEKAYRLAPNNQDHFVRLLVARQAAGRMSQQDAEALELIREQEAAKVAQNFSLLRLDILQARRALQGGDLDLARTKVDHAAGIVGALPRYVDAKPYRRELTGLRQAIVRRGSVRSAKVEPDRGAVPPPSLTDTGPSSPDPYGSGEIIDIDDLVGSDQAPHAYARALDQALRRDRVERFLSNTEAALPPVGDLSFPADWPQRSAKRSAYRDGVIYKGPEFTGQDGQTYYTAIYDLAELVHPVPNFYAAYPGTAREQRQQTLDRLYLRERSYIFNGWPEDLAAGLPLLHFFGGVDNNAVSMRTDPYETARIVQTIQAFIQSR